MDLVSERHEYQRQVDVCDPWVNHAEAVHEYGINLVQAPEAGAYAATVLAVAHHQFREMDIEAIRKLGKAAHRLYDLNYVCEAHSAYLRL